MSEVKKALPLSERVIAAAKKHNEMVPGYMLEIIVEVETQRKAMNALHDFTRALESWIERSAQDLEKTDARTNKLIDAYREIFPERWMRDFFSEYAEGYDPDADKGPEADKKD